MTRHWRPAPGVPRGPQDGRNDDGDEPPIAAAGCWHRALAVLLVLDAMLLPATAFIAGAISDSDWAAFLALLVLRYGVVLGGCAMFLAHGYSCKRSGLLCPGTRATSRRRPALLAWFGVALQIVVAGSITGLAVTGGEPLPSTYLALTGRTVAAHVVGCTVEPGLDEPGDEVDAAPPPGPPDPDEGRCDQDWAQDPAVRVWLAGPDGQLLGTVDRGSISFEGLPSKVSATKLVLVGFSTLPVVVDRLSLAAARVEAPDGGVSIRHRGFGILLAAEALTLLLLLLGLIPRRSPTR